MSTVPGDERETSGVDAVGESAEAGSAASGVDAVGESAEAGSAASAAPTGERTARKTTRERAEEKRQAKLDLVREQVESGSLVIRQMTDEERQRYAQPARPPRLARGR